jgi:hypothetical protein
MSAYDPNQIQARFRTIHVCPEDLASALCQAEDIPNGRTVTRPRCYELDAIWPCALELGLHSGTRRGQAHVESAVNNPEEHRCAGKS